MRREIVRHLLVLIVYLAVVMVAKWHWSVELVWLWLGGLVGFFLVFVDRLVYVYFLYPYEQLSEQVRYMVGQRNFKGAVELTHRRRGEQMRLVFRSLLFVVAWVALAIFALTSTGEMFAEALVMGLGLHLVYDFWRDQLTDPLMLNRKLFWQVKRKVGLEEQKLLLYGLSGVFVLLSWWWI